MPFIKFTTKAGPIYINPAFVQAVDKDNLGSYVRLTTYSQGVLESIEVVMERLGYPEVDYKVTAIVPKPAPPVAKPTPTKKQLPATKKKAKKR